jgi:hypothetical protein
MKKGTIRALAVFSCVSTYNYAMNEQTWLSPQSGRFNHPVAISSVLGICCGLPKQGIRDMAPVIIPPRWSV